MPSCPTRVISSRALCVLLLAMLALAAGGCKRTPAELPGASAEPAAAVRTLARALQRNDLLGYAQAAVPPAQYQRLQQAWSEDRSRWPLTELPLAERLPEVLDTLAAPDAERQLQRAFDAQFGGQAASLKQAAHSLGLFGVQFLRNQGHYTPEQRGHYVQLVQALSAWAARAPLSERKRAQAALARLCAGARRTGVRSDADLRTLGMDESLRRLGPFLADLKAVLADYGLDLDASAGALRTGLVNQQGDQAVVRIQYPLDGEQIDTTAVLVRRDGHWYLRDTLSEVDALLAASAGTAAPAAAPAADPALPAKR
ncbi:hypothetical protein J7373_08900 [Xanthomonas sp. A2111]|uniref:DUF3828 domain-containing protein n=1 Tax=Xanthomonas hawaiiensis TaxID=3003247 RepID=A0ABU2I647_9XANT|nr:hypothetical protein [Xanthomonas sp. A2111]MBO9828361.1 hypothetical protein [Xanthomonas sp. A2111]MDS9993108.1 hypothetical protein [Xanthomonas sp. A2111]